MFSGVPMPAATTARRATNRTATSRRQAAVDLELARARRIEDVLIERGHKLRRQGGELIGPCPVCGGTDRFGINLKKQIWNCRGCAKGGDVIALVQHIDGSTFIAAIETLTGGRAPPTRQRRPKPVQEHEDDGRWIKWWDEARPVAGTLAERYLIHRRITELPPDCDGEALRFHPECIFGNDDAGVWRYAPAMLALVVDPVTNVPKGLQRTDLNSNWDHPDRRALGSIKGGVVKLWSDADVTEGLCIAEGLETALAASLQEWPPGSGVLIRPIWATLNAGNMHTFPVLPGISHLTISVDDDDAGHDAAIACSARWQTSGVGVTRLVPTNKGAADGKN
jgi:hypothetical protein